MKTVAELKDKLSKSYQAEIDDGASYDSFEEYLIYCSFLYNMVRPY